MIHALHSYNERLRREKGHGGTAPDYMIEANASSTWPLS